MLRAVPIYDCRRAAKVKDMSLKDMLDNLDALPKYEDGDVPIGSAALLCYNVNTFVNTTVVEGKKIPHGTACGYNLQWVMLLGVPRR